jgi:REP element-mobilizing transposase RayT
MTINVTSQPRQWRRSEELAMANTYSNLLYHLIFSTKNRIPLISESLRPELYAYMGGIVRAEGATLLEIGGISDHVHLLAKLKPTKAVSELLGRVKAKSSKWVNERKANLRKFGWQDGYAAFSVSESQITSVQRYIRDQPRRHRRLSFQDEFQALLQKHGVEYDERYLWG